MLNRSFYMQTTIDKHTTKKNNNNIKNKKLKTLELKKKGNRSNLRKLRHFKKSPPVRDEPPRGLRDEAEAKQDCQRGHRRYEGQEAPAVPE